MLTWPALEKRHEELTNEAIDNGSTEKIIVQQLKCHSDENENDDVHLELRCCYHNRTPTLGEVSICTLTPGS